jgi:hypothetical protein
MGGAIDLPAAFCAGPRDCADPTALPTNQSAQSRQSAQFAPVKALAIVNGRAARARGRLRSHSRRLRHRLYR